ncbi:hypothetical protein EIP75_00020 [Aquabacterium soli]|uniref:Uncharacterized protein n=1 Tax=Aquabacterium soli TaxID=2493092 RepID=A0A3R8S4S7_9BURK|nr:hypothetical protein [Aquabacterium soli]RRS06039.1 hypothetical protein EIP75_00020 [Aquabacterium soli]
MKDTRCTAVLLALSILLPLAHAERSAMKPSNASQNSPVVARGLSPEQISAIRKVGRNVLAAKKGGAEDATDVEQLAQLRATLSRVVAADVGPQNRGVLSASVQNEMQKLGNSAENDAHPQPESRRAARANARALVAQLKGRGEWKASRSRSVPEDDTLSAGMPIGKQRAQLFERWAEKLDTALADDGPDGPRDLLVLHQQLQGELGRPSDVPAGRGTPTLKAMPAETNPARRVKASKSSGN